MRKNVDINSKLILVNLFDNYYFIYKKKNVWPYENLSPVSLSMSRPHPTCQPSIAPASELFFLSRAFFSHTHITREHRTPRRPSSQLWCVAAASYYIVHTHSFLVFSIPHSQNLASARFTIRVNPPRPAQRSWRCANGENTRNVLHFLSLLSSSFCIISIYMCMYFTYIHFLAVVREFIVARQQRTKGAPATIFTSLINFALFFHIFLIIIYVLCY